jgi:hypothetical protein
MRDLDTSPYSPNEERVCDYSKSNLHQDSAAHNANQRAG